MTNFSVWSLSRLESSLLPGAVADPIWLKSESAPGPRTAGAAHRSGGSATLFTTLHFCRKVLTFNLNFSEFGLLPDHRQEDSFGRLQQEQGILLCHLGP